MPFEEFYEDYSERYQIIQHQRELTRQESIPSIEKFKLQPNSMQVGFISNLKKILAAGEERALLISATGTGKTYASAFAMRELGFKRVLFLVHRGQLARQTKESYERVFSTSVSMGLVGDGCRDYEADYVFATVQTLNRDEHLLQYEKNAFDCIVLDEAHHVPANTYQKNKSKGFAAGCSREVIARGAEQLGWELDALLEKTLEAMKSTEDIVHAEMEAEFPQ